jgi:FlgD Ig-like domain
MNIRKSVLITFCLLCLVVQGVGANELEISGVFGIAPIPEGSALAVWVPLEENESISGVMWYNNDGSIAFPEVLAVAGSAEYPSVLDLAVVVGENISGNTLDWSELSFQSSFASAGPGLFLVFRLPSEGEFIAEGEGSGLGYHLGDGEVRCWISGEEGQWGQLSPEYQMAVVPVMNTNKSGEVVVLEYAEGIDTLQEEEVAPVELISGLAIFPNPFNPQTEISFSLPSSREVTLSIYDLRGRKVHTLVSGVLEAGTHTVKWYGRNDKGRTQASGVYFCKLQAGSIQLTGRLTMIR